MSSFPLIDNTRLDTITAHPGLVLLDFWQASCAPCRALEPVLEQFSATHPGLFEGYRIDVDTQQDLVERYQVTSIPTIVILRDGHEMNRLDGLIREADLKHAIQ